MMTAERTILASKQANKQGVTLSFFHVKLKTAQKRKAYSARLTAGECAFFVLPDRRHESIGTTFTFSAGFLAGAVFCRSRL